jgi:6-phospho-beta-glucosidase
MLPDAKIGPAIGLSPNYPESFKPEDVQAAREANDFRNYLFTDLYMYRRYRDNVWRYMVENDVTPTIQEGDMDLLKSVKPELSWNKLLPKQGSKICFRNAEEQRFEY